MGAHQVLAVFVVVCCTLSSYSCSYAYKTRPQETFIPVPRPVPFPPQLVATSSLPPANQGEGEEEEKEEQESKLAKEQTQTAEEEAEDDRAATNGRHQRRHATQCPAEEDLAMLLDFVHTIDEQLDEGVPVLTIRDYLIFTFGTSWDEELNNRVKRAPGNFLGPVAKIITRVATPRAGAAAGAAAGRGPVAAAAAAPAGVAAVAGAVARRTPQAFLKRMAQRFPGLAAQGATIWGVSASLEAIARAAGGGGAAEQGVSEIATEMDRLEAMIFDVMDNMSIVFSLALTHHDGLRKAAEAKLESERLAHQQEQLRLESERNQTAASIAGFLAEIIARQKDSNHLLVRTERMISDNPLVFSSAGGLSKRSAGDEWGDVATNFRQGEQEIKEALLTFASLMNEKVQLQETAEAAEVAATKISGMSVIKSRFRQIMDDKAKGNCSAFFAEQRELLFFASLGSLFIGGAIPFLVAAIMWWCDRWCTRGCSR